MSSFLILDLGTTTIKTYIVSSKLELRGYHQTTYESLKPARGLHEQDPNVWWSEIKASIQSVLSGSDVNKNEILAITIVTQRGTILPIDSEGKLLFNALTWMDSRRPKLDEEQRSRISGRVALEKVLWFKQEKPGIYEKTLKFALPDSYLAFKLTGKVVSSPSQAVYLFYNEINKEYDYTTLQELGIDAEKLPSVKSSGTIVGELDTEVAKELGLRPRTPVVIGGGDQQVAALGLGVIDVGQTKMTLGTGLFIDTVVNSKILDFYDDNLKMFCLPHALEKKWLVEATIPGIGQTLEWFIKHFAKDTKERASRLKISPLSLLDEEAGEISPSIDNPVFVPLASFGLGMWRNLSLHHSRAVLYRSILESAGYASKFFLELFQGLNIEIKDIFVEGGGSRSKVWVKIIADITQFPLKLLKTREYATGLGGAILASTALKEVRDPIKMIKEAQEEVDVVEPSQDDLETYNNLFEIFTDNLLEEAKKI